MVKNCTNFALSFYAVYKNPHILLILYNIFSHIASGGAAGHKKYPLSAIIGRKGM